MFVTHVSTDLVDYHFVPSFVLEYEGRRERSGKTLIPWSGSVISQTRHATSHACGRSIDQWD